MIVKRTGNEADSESKVLWASFFSALVLASASLTNTQFAEASSFQSETVVQCLAPTHGRLIECLNDAAGKDPSLHLDILVTADLTLELGQTIVLDGLENVTLRGAAGQFSDLPITIKETDARMRSDADADQSYISVTGGSRKIQIENFRLIDSDDSESFLKFYCRTGAPGARTPNLWNEKYCHAPLAVGDSALEARDVTVQKVQIVSHKAILMEVRKTFNLNVSDSLFDGGTVGGVFFFASTRHYNSTFARNTFMHAGTAALLVCNAFNTLVVRNTFVDNHIDPQYVDPETGQLFSGGSLFITSRSNFVRLLNNEVSMTPAYTGQCNRAERPPYPGCKTTTGIEIVTGQGGEVTDILVEGNRVHDMSRKGIAVHNSDSRNQKRIVVRNNILTNNYVDFPGYADNSVAAYVNLEAFQVTEFHADVDVDSNLLSRDGFNIVTGSFLETPKTCVVDAVTKKCSIQVRWRITGFSPTSIPVVRVNGKLMAKSRLTDDSVLVDWIQQRQFTFTLHLNENDPHPVAVINVEGLAQ